MHHVFFDEFTYINMAKNIYTSNMVGETALANKLDLKITEEIIRPAGYPFLLNLLFRILPDSENSVYFFNVLLGSVSVVLIFWICLLLFSNNIGIGLWAAAIFNFLPAHLKYSGCGNYDISSLFFILLSLWFILFYLKNNRIVFIYLATFAGIFSAYIKAENLLYYFLILILLWHRKKSKEISYVNFISFITVTLIFSIFMFAQIPYMISLENYYAKHSFWSVSNFLKNYLPNLRYLFDLRYHSAVGTIFMIIGATLLFFKNKKLFVILTAWSILFFFLPTAYFWGRWSLMYTADSDRHFLPFAVSFSILGGYGIYSLIGNVTTQKRIVKIILITVIGLAIIINSIFATNKIISFTFKRSVYKEYVFLKENLQILPEDLYILIYNPSLIVALTDRSVINFDSFFRLENFPSRIILFKDYWWFKSMARSLEFEAELKKIYNFKIITEQRCSPDEKYGFYLLSKKE